MTLTKNKAIAFIAALILFYLAMPYFVWHSLLSSVYVKTLLAFIVGGLFLINKRKWTNTERYLFFLLLGTLILYPIVADYNFNYFLSLLPVVFLPFTKESFSRDVFRFFLDIYVVMVGLALGFWLLALIGLIGPIRVIPPLNAVKSINYSVYPFFVTEAGSPLLRFMGPFDEPGVIGTLSGILLCIEKFDLRNRKTIVLLLSGLLSLSFFFYILVSVYFVLYYAVRKGSFFKTILMILIVGGVFYTIRNVPQLYDAIGYRFEWDADKGKIVGDSRIDLDIVEEYYDQIQGTKQFWFGIDNKDEYLDAVAGSSSFMTVIIVNGMVFIILYLTFFVWYAIHYRETWGAFLLFLFVFLGTIYQRPSTFNILFLYLFTYLAKQDYINKVTDLNRLVLIEN